MITIFLKYKFKNLYLKIPILRNNIMKNNLNSLELQKYIKFIQSKRCSKMVFGKELITDSILYIGLCR